MLVLHSEKMICPNCQRDRVANNGRQQGKQHSGTDLDLSVTFYDRVLGRF